LPPAGWDFDHLVTTQPTFEPFHHRLRRIAYLDLSQGYESYAAQRRAAGSDEIKQISRKLRKCEREQGEVTFEMDCRDETLLDLLIQWKSAQLRQNGLMDIFAFPWTVELMKSIFRGSSETLSGLLSW